MGIFKKDYSDIGKNGTVEEFLSELKKEMDYSYNNRAKNENLINGALLAFRAGSPENIQTALLNEKSYSAYYSRPVPSILLKLTEGCTDKLAIIDSALAKIPAQDKKEVLSEALSEAIRNGIGGES